MAEALPGLTGRMADFTIDQEDIQVLQHLPGVGAVPWGVAAAATATHRRLNLQIEKDAEKSCRMVVGGGELGGRSIRTV